MTMKLRDIISANKETTDSAAHNPVGVFIGATSGLGECSAYNFAKYSIAPKMYVVGRNTAAGSKVVARIKELNSQADVQFVACDITLIKEVDKLCDLILQKETVINLLFLSAGFVSFQGLTKSAEGIDTKLAANYYGRWRFVERFLPLIQKAAEQDEIASARALTDGEYAPVNARVVSVLEPGAEGPIDLDNLDLSKKFSLSLARRHSIEFNSLATLRFGRLYPDIGFIHIGPGLVKTGIARSLPLWARIPSRIGMLFANTAQNAAERLYYAATTSRFRRGPFILDGNHKSMRERAERRGYLTVELQDAVWKHTEHLYAMATGTLKVESTITPLHLEIPTTKLSADTQQVSSPELEVAEISESEQEEIVFDLAGLSPSTDNKYANERGPSPSNIDLEGDAAEQKA